MGGAFLLTGCFNIQKPEEKIYDLLESVATTEKSFEEQQDPLVQLEKEEKTLYDEIISLGKKEQDKINQLSDSALENIDKRKKHMEMEQESLQASKKEFIELESLIEKLKDEKERDLAVLLNQTMMDRYRAHDELFSNYNLGLDHDKQLYELLKDKKTTINQLEKQIVEINDTYKKVIESNKEFNDLTKKYNETKLAFYKSAEIKIKTK